MKTAQLLDDFYPRPQKEMVGINQDDLGTHLLKNIMGQGFDRALAGDRHKGWRLDQSVSRNQKSGPRPAGRIPGSNCKGTIHVENLK